MNDAFRAFIYPLGFLASFAFGARIFFQWWTSEVEKRSVSNALFWKLSIVGNLLFFVHSTIQCHFPVALMQALLAVLAFRNLNLMKEQEKHYNLFSILFSLVATACFVTSLFYAQAHFFADGQSMWLRAPSAFGLKKEDEIPLLIHVIGIFGVAIFSLRFWIQWLQAEKKQKSSLQKNFWYLSLFGASLSSVYFLLLKDPVNLIGPLFALIPYFRNLMLTSQIEKKEKEMPSQKRSIFIFAGEVSADLYGKEIIKELQKKLSDFELFGVGGKEMEAQSFSSLMPMSNFQVMGVSAVIKKLPTLLFSFYKLKKEILRRKPDLCLFIDQPDFSMRLARALRKANFAGKIVQFVAPTVWAWRKKRAEALASDFDLLLTLFPFENQHFQHTSLKTVWVGHPIVEIIEATLQSAEKEKLLTIFPGSRPQEIVKNLQNQLEAACLFCQNEKDFKIAISLAQPRFKAFILKEVEKIRKKTNFSGSILFFSFEDRHKMMQRSCFALAKCGTVTLELALFEVPTIVTYELSALNRILAKYIYKLDTIPYFSIVNILKEKELFSELVKKKITALDIYEKLKAQLSDEEYKGLVKKELRELKALLQAQKKPSQMTCESILQILQELKI